MTLGQVAGLIAALAFVVLVIFLGMMLVQLAKVLKNLQATVEETTKTVKTLTIDVDKIANQGNDLTAKVNVLMDDVNSKIASLNPLFGTLENVGTSLEKMTDKSESSSKLHLGKLTPKTAGKLAKVAWKIYRKK